MGRTWVISPNVLNDSVPTSTFLKLIRDRKAAMMGWPASHRLGGLFAEIDQGDLVIVAQGANWQKRVYFTGYATAEIFSEEIGGQSVQCRRLRNFADLTGASIPFSEDCTFFSASQIPAIYRLKEQNPADVAVISAVTEYLQSQYMQQQLEIYTGLLFSHHQLILTGAPGTGKTYTAKALVNRQVGGEAARTAFVQFHPSFDYTDFIEGLKPAPQSSNGQVGFELRNGIFKEFCRRAGLPERLEEAKVSWSEENVRRFLADDEEGQKFWLTWLKEWKNPDDLMTRPEIPRFFLIIDEINRADLSRVLGELLFALEPEYRGSRGAVKTQYASLNDERTFFLRPKDDRFFCAWESLSHRHDE